LDGDIGDDVLAFVDVNPNQPVTTRDIGMTESLAQQWHNRQNQQQKWHFKLLRKIPSSQKLCPRSFWSLPHIGNSHELQGKTGTRVCL
jgi:hypothetical protein